MSDSEVTEPALAEGTPPVAAVPGIQPPTGLNLSSKNKSENWKLYKQQWQNYQIVAQLNKKTEEYRIALFLYSIGPKAVKTYNSFDLSDEDKRNLDAIIAAFDKYAIGETKVTFERYLFNKRDQQEGESIDQFVAELRILAQSCNFCDCLNDSLIRDRIVLGIKDSGTRLLQQQQLTLQRCIDICKSSEASNTQIRSLGQFVKEEVRRVKDYNKPARAKSSANSKNQKQTWKVDRKFDRKSPDKKAPSRRICRFCGGTHRFGREQCPAWGATCTSCGKENHFAKCCQSTRRGKMHAVREEYEQTSSESDFIDCVTLAQPDAINAVEQCGDANEIYAEMILGGRPVRFHIDCGATVNVLPAKYVESKEIKSTKKVLQMWNKSELKPEGVTRVTIRNPKNNKKYSVEFVVVKEELSPLLGAKASQHMGLLEIHPENFRQVANVKMPQGSETARAKTADQLIKEYHDVFEGDLGTLPGTQRLEVDPSVTPSISPSRRVPLA